MLAHMATRVDLPIEGMTCAACATRIGRGLSKLEGVERADVNLAAARATVVFDPGAVDEADFRTTIEGLGYALAAEGTDPELVRLGVIRRRLFVAIALPIPTLAISMIGPLHFDGWQWVVGLLATPVVLWSGAGFHRAALVNLRHGTATMDTLVSMGTLAAWTWSWVSLLALDAGDAGGMDAGSDAHVYFETAAVIVTLILLGKWFEAR